MFHYEDPQGKLYLPILVQHIHKDGNWVHLSDAQIGITNGDMLITKGPTNLYVSEIYWEEDFFEDRLTAKLNPSTNDPAMFDLCQHIKVGDELKLLGSLHGEK